MNPVVEVTSVAHGGEGICRIDGQVCFVAYGLPGDRVAVRVMRRTKNALWGIIEDLIEPSPDRIAPPCPHFGTCGGCTWLHFAYPAQAEWKQRIVRDCLTRIAGIDIEPERVEDAGLRLGYRTRAEFHAREGRVGFYALRSHDVVDLEGCPLCHDTLNAAFRRLRAVRMSGSVEVVTNPLGDEVLVWPRRPYRRLKNVFPLCNWAGDHSNRASFVFDGAPVVNGAFCQASLLLNRMLLETVRGLVGRPGTLLDLYCGNGNLSLGLAAEVRVLGLDRDGAAVRAANAVGPGDYRQGDETAFRKAIASGAWDVILLDPPRVGAKALMNELAHSAAQALVYVSCDPATLARDVKTLAQAGWRLERAVVVDMFPHTAHIEAVCRLER